MQPPANDPTTVDGGWLVGLDGYEDMVRLNDRLIVGQAFEISQFDPHTGALLAMDEAGDGPGSFAVENGNITYADEDEEFDFGPATEASVWPSGRAINDGWTPDLPKSISSDNHSVILTADGQVKVESAGQAWVLEPVEAMVNWGAYISTGWLYIATADERLAGIDLSGNIGEILVQLGLVSPQ